MTRHLTEEQAARRAKRYPVGARIKLIRFATAPGQPDDNLRVPSGTEGTVWSVDSAGTVHTNWDNGRNLGVLPEDDVKIISLPDQ